MKNALYSIRNSVRRVVLLSLVVVTLTMSPLPMRALLSTNPVPPPPTAAMSWGMMAQVALSALGLY